MCKSYMHLQYVPVDQMHMFSSGWSRLLERVLFKSCEMSFDEGLRGDRGAGQAGTRETGL